MSETLDKKKTLEWIDEHKYSWRMGAEHVDADDLTDESPMASYRLP